MSDLTRRDFIKAASVAGAAVTGLANVPFVHAAGSDTIKVGIIGCGGRGSGAGKNVLSAAKNVQVVALADAFKQRVTNTRNDLTKFAKNDNIKGMGNTVEIPDSNLYDGLDAYESLISNKDVNYVILATPPGFRPLHIQAAVAAGKTIFAEKPVAVDGTGIRKVLSAYDESVKKGLGIAAGTQRRHQLGYLETMKRIHGGDIGDIVGMRCAWDNSHDIWFRKRSELADFLKVENTELAYQLHNWYHFLWVCGDHICEQHVHNLDVCNWAMASHPVRAVGVGGRFGRKGDDPKEHGNIWDNFSINYEYEGKDKRSVQMYSTCLMIEGGKNNVTETLIGTKGYSQVNDYLINGQKVVSREQAGAATDPYVQEHTDLIESVRNGKPINELKNVAESTLTAIMGRMSCYTGQPVTWNQALTTKEDTFLGKLSWNMKIDTPPVPVPGKTKLI